MQITPQQQKCKWMAIEVQKRRKVKLIANLSSTVLYSKQHDCWMDGANYTQHRGKLQTCSTMVTERFTLMCIQLQITTIYRSSWIGKETICWLKWNIYFSPVDRSISISTFISTSATHGNTLAATEIPKINLNSMNITIQTLFKAYLKSLYSDSQHPSLETLGWIKTYYISWTTWKCLETWWPMILPRSIWYLQFCTSGRVHMEWVLIIYHSHHLMIIRDTRNLLPGNLTEIFALPVYEMYHWTIQDHFDDEVKKIW